MKQTTTNEDFILQAKEVRPDKNYGYHKVDYKVSKINVIIVCPVHGDFQQIPVSHLQGRGCNDCGSLKTGDIKRKPLE